MSILFAFVGIVLGGLMFQFFGAVSGGLIGWLFAGLHDLQQRLEKQQQELTWLRKKLGEHIKDACNEMPPDAAVLAEAARVAEPANAYRPTPRPIERPIEQPIELPVDRVREPLRPSSEVATPAVAPEIEPEPEFEFVREALTPSEPSAFEEWLRGIFSAENLLVKLGVLILFFGVSFLVKYAAQHGLFPIELRLTAAALGGCALLATGWRLRDKRPAYAQVIQGGGVGILYLTTYAALHLYHLIPTGLGFGLLVAICALSAVLAVAQNSRPLAVMGSAGGFLAPELAGIAGDNPAMLFGFYAVLNCGILAIARLRAWRELNLLGFAGTFIVGALWGARFYRPEFFFSVEPFLLLFFLIYAVLPVLYAGKQATVLDGYVDCTLVFGTPILAFAMQSALVRHYEYGLAWSALAAGIFYIALATRLFRGEPERMRRLAEAFLALGTVFGTLSIPLAFEGRWTSAAWSIEGAALVWTGLRQQRRLARAFGYLLLIGSGLVFLFDNHLAGGVWPVLNSFYVGSLLIAGAALFSARLLGRSERSLMSYEYFAESVLFAWGMLWWFAAGLHEIVEHSTSDLAFGAALAFVALSCQVCMILRKRLDWQLLEWPAFGLLPAMAGFALLQVLGEIAFPSLRGGWFGWPLALAAWYLILHANRRRRPQLPAVVHAAPLWLLTLLLAWEAYGRVSQQLPGMETWAVCAWGVVPALMVLLIARFGQKLPWPVDGNLSAYLGLGTTPLAFAALLWLLFVNLTRAGNPWPLPYLPLLNPQDGATLLVLVSLVCWYRAIQRSLPGLAQMVPRQEAAVTLALTLFVWLNAILLRTVHHWSGVPFTLHGLFASPMVQTTLSICWCLLALTVMILATRRGLRHIWMAGAGLLEVVVAKLFLVDLAGHGSLARIVSFVVVGLLILLIGWFSPVPPRASQGGVP